MRTRIVGLSPWIVALVLALLCVGQSASANHSKNEVIVIGDSLSDTGNLYALTGWFPPSPPYAERFSNGPIWAEYFADQLHVRLDSRAYGGAFTGVVEVPVAPGVVLPFTNLDNLQYPGLFEPLPGLTEEVDELLADHPKGLNPRALYVIWAGANDFFWGLANPDLMGAMLQGAIQNVAATVCRLGGEGARNFAVANLPDLGLTPLGRSLPDGGAATLSYLANSFNQGLAQALAGLPKHCADTVLVLDAFQDLREIVENKADYGFTNVEEACVDKTGGVPVVSEACAAADPDAFLFWDDVHPTTVAHSILADRFLADFCGAPKEHGRRHQRPGYKPPQAWREVCERWR